LVARLVNGLPAPLLFPQEEIKWISNRNLWVKKILAFYNKYLIRIVISTLFQY